MLRGDAAGVLRIGADFRNFRERMMRGKLLLVQIHCDQRQAGRQQRSGDGRRLNPGDDPRGVQTAKGKDSP